MLANCLKYVRRLQSYSHRFSSQYEDKRTWSILDCAQLVSIHLHPHYVLSHFCTKRIFLAFEWTGHANALRVCLLHTKVQFTSSAQSLWIYSQM